MTKKPGQQLYVILREDTFDIPPCRTVVVTAVWADHESAEKEVQRLNALRGLETTRYWWLATRTRDPRIKVDVV